MARVVCSLAQPEASEAKSGGLNSRAAEPIIKWFHTIVADSHWRLSPSRFASWKQLVRLQAWVQSYVCNCRAPVAGRQSGGLFPEKIEDAEMALIRSAQRDEFSEYDLLKKNKPLPSASKLQNLQPRIDESGAIRVEGHTERGLPSIRGEAPNHPAEAQLGDTSYSARSAYSSKACCGCQSHMGIAHATVLGDSG